MHRPVGGSSRGLWCKVDWPVGGSTGVSNGAGESAVFGADSPVGGARLGMARPCCMVCGPAGEPGPVMDWLSISDWMQTRVMSEINRPVGGKTGRPTLPRDFRRFSNDQVHQISGVFPNWALIYYVKMPCTDPPHTKEFPTSNNWHHIVLRAFLSPKCGR